MVLETNMNEIIARYDEQLKLEKTRSGTYSWNHQSYDGIERNEFATKDKRY